MTPIAKTNATPPAKRSCLRLSLAATTLIIATGLSAPAIAQSMPFSAIDQDDDMVLSFAELVAAFGESGARALLRDTDDNDDGNLTDREIRSSGSDDRNDDRRDDRNDDKDDDRDDDNDDEGDDD